MKVQRGIQSVEVGGRLLLALAHEGRPLPLKELAQAADMAPAKAHPYLVSFGKLGLISQDEVSGRYGLGPLAMQLGLILVGHVIGIVVAHRVGHRLFEDRRAALRSLVPVFSLMVVVSVAGLGLRHRDMNMRLGRM